MRVAILLLLLAALQAQAEIYRWVDADGTVHFSDEPRPDAGEVERVQLRQINSVRSVEIDTAPGPARTTQGAGAPEVIMYSASWCVYCDRARDHFEADGIRYREYDVENSAKGRRDYDRLNGRGVPIILVDDRRMNGFSPEGFARIHDR